LAPTSGIHGSKLCRKPAPEPCVERLVHCLHVTAQHLPECLGSVETAAVGPKKSTDRRYPLFGLDHLADERGKSVRERHLFWIAWPHEAVVETRHRVQPVRLVRRNELR